MISYGYVELMGKVQASPNFTNLVFNGAEKHHQNLYTEQDFEVVYR